MFLFYSQKRKPKFEAQKLKDIAIGITLWATMHKEVLYVIHHTMKAAETTNPLTKKKALEKVQTQLSALRIPLIYCAKNKIMSMQQYKNFDAIIDEVRRMTYGWNRSIRP